MAAPVLAAVALTFAVIEPSHWRRSMLVSVIVMLVSLSTVEFVRLRRHGLGGVLVPINVLMPVVGQLMLVTATGGLFSPMVPVVLIMAMLSGLLTDCTTLQRLITIVAPSFWLLALVHRSGMPVDALIPHVFGAARSFERGSAPLVAASLYTLMLLVTAGVGRRLQQLYEALYREGLGARDRALALHAEQSRTLTTLSGEIAHELKNPLSSVKGLAALIAKDVSGRTAERLAVLRAEVDRMQASLEDFLNFSRPLVPLAVAELDLAELAHDVVRLHEGSALERHVSLRVEGEKQARLVGDLRKIRQVLINVLQNAIEASPTGALVSVRVRQTGALLSVRVQDQGPGLPGALGSRIFEAGVTTKEQGSGLGLVVARALARQHGGELTLRDALQGGAVAELTLPRTPGAGP